MKVFRELAIAASLLWISVANAQAPQAAPAPGGESKPTITKSAAPSPQAMAGIRALMEKTAPKAGGATTRLSRDGIGAMSSSLGCNLADGNSMDPGCFGDDLVDYYSFAMGEQQIDLIIPKSHIGGIRGVIVCNYDECERYSGFEAVDHEWVEQRVGQTLADSVHDWWYTPPPASVNLCSSSRTESKNMTKNTPQSVINWAVEETYTMLMNWYTNYGAPSDWTKGRTEGMQISATLGDGTTASYTVQWASNSPSLTFVQGSLSGGTGVARSACPG